MARAKASRCNFPTFSSVLSCVESATGLTDLEMAVARYQRRIYTFAHYFLGNWQEAEDVTQEVLLRLWRRGGAIEAAGLLPWLLRVTRNACYDLLRRRRPGFALSSPEADSAAQRVPDGTPGPEAAAAATEARDRVRGALRRLPEPYRSAVILREVQGLSYQEIGEALDIPLNTVRVHIHRGRQKLRDLLREETATCRMARMS
jgi:RNA polymerase sigma factor (sigma-70 family)